MPAESQTESSVPQTESSVPQTGADDASAEGEGVNDVAGAVSDPDRSQDSLRKCVVEHEAAQLAKLSGGLLQARDHMVSCSAVECPEALRRDCVAWSEEIAQEVPTVVVDARDLGEDLESALVTVDGEIVRDRLDGRPLELDPGAHEIQVKLADGRIRERRVVLVSGQKGRRVSFLFREAPQPIKAEVIAPVEMQTIRPVTALTYVLGGVAVVAAGVGTGFGIRALKMKSEADDNCAPLCDASVKRALEERAAVSDIAWGVAGASAVGALVSYVWRPTQEVPLESGQSVSVEVMVSGTALAVGGSF